jgi:hypothetical protein
MAFEILKKFIDFDSSIVQRHTVAYDIEIDNKNVETQLKQAMQDIFNF